MSSLLDICPHAIRPARPSSRQAGFTLLELMVVIVILGMLAAIATPQVMKYLGGAKVDTARLQIQNLSTILDMYRLQTGSYPTTAEGLAVLVEKPASAANWNGPYVKRKESLIDPWGSPFLYRYPGQHAEFDLYSLGESRTEGGRTIANW
ncbi:MAG TPA: type II secretion system major pseudopilin GspG [Azospirillum sp.]|nr:type II secretion system major pseudopilin GspG [Azospirillum sp.]